MPSFKGQYEYAVDEKGRIMLPLKLRRALSPEAEGRFVVTRGEDPCLVLYPVNVWQLIEDQLRQQNLYQQNVRRFVRELLRWAEDVELDGQNRLMIPRELLQWAGIRGRVLLVGMLDRIELWNPETFAQHELGVQQFGQEAEWVMGGSR